MACCHWFGSFITTSRIGHVVFRCISSNIDSAPSNNKLGFYTNSKPITLQWYSEVFQNSLRWWPKYMNKRPSLYFVSRTQSQKIQFTLTLWSIKHNSGHICPHRERTHVYLMNQIKLLHSLTNVKWKCLTFDKFIWTRFSIQHLGLALI